MVTRFFREDLAGRQVFLFVTAEVLDQVASRFSLDHTDFIRAIAGEPGSIEASQVAQRAVRLCATGRWRNSPTVVYPPYVAHLCLFVYAAATDEAEDLAVTPTIRGYAESLSFQRTRVLSQAFKNSVIASGQTLKNGPCTTWEVISASFGEGCSASSGTSVCREVRL